MTNYNADKAYIPTTHAVTPLGFYGLFIDNPNCIPNAANISVSKRGYIYWNNVCIFKNGKRLNKRTGEFYEAKSNTITVYRVSKDYAGSGLVKRFTIEAYRIIALAHLLQSDYSNANPRVNLDNALRAMYPDSTLTTKELYMNICDKLFNNRRYVTHHLDGNHHNNKANNLVMLSNSDHAKAHKYLNDIGAAFANDDIKLARTLREQYRTFCYEHSTLEYLMTH